MKRPIPSTADRTWSALLLAGALLLAPASHALTLDEALAHADAPHPELDRVQAGIDLARAEAELAASLDAFTLSLEGALRSGRNRFNDDRFAPDHMLRLGLRKSLWDGGRTRAGQTGAELEAGAAETRLLDARAQRRLTLMSRFFDVLLADLHLTAQEEFTASAWVNWDNGRERAQLGELSPVAMAELESRFQDRRALRNQAQRQAREKRALLAQAMNRPELLPGALVEPRLASNDRPLPDFAALWPMLEQHNPLLGAKQKQLAAAEQRLTAARLEAHPSLSLEAEAAAYSRDALTRDNLRAGIHLSWPILSGRRDEAGAARERARLAALRAEHDALRLELRQALLEAWEEIHQLRGSERPAAVAQTAFRDWALERARGEYELELKTNLGSSMAETQVAKLRQRAIEYRLALAWERLAGLIGTDLPQPDRKESKP